MRHVWHDLDAALVYSLLRLTFEQRRDVERRLDKAILRARRREEQRRATLLAIREALGLMPAIGLAERRVAYVVMDRARAGMALPVYYAALRQENLERAQYWARVSDKAKPKSQLDGSTRRTDRRVSHLDGEG